jgi:hypothetical protein
LTAAKNGSRFSPFTALIKQFYSRFRSSKVAFPTVGMIDLDDDHFTFIYRSFFFGLIHMSAGASGKI